MTNIETTELQLQLTELFHSEADELQLPSKTWSDLAPRLGDQQSLSLFFRLNRIIVGLRTPNLHVIAGFKKYAVQASTIIFVLIAVILSFILMNDDSDEVGPAPAAVPTIRIVPDDPSPEIGNSLEIEEPELTEDENNLEIDEPEATGVIAEITSLESPTETVASAPAAGGAIPATIRPIPATVRAFIAPTAETSQLEEKTANLPDDEVIPTITPTALPYISVERPFGLIALWSGEGNGRNGAPGSIFGSIGSSEFGTGINGLAFEISPAHQRITLPHEVLDGAGNVTFEVWVNSSQPGGAVISGAGGLSPSEFVLLVGGLSTPWPEVVPDAITIFVRGRFAIFDTHGIGDGMFHHIVWTRRSDGRNELYFDGNRIGEATLSAGELAIGNKGLMLGQSQSCTGCPSDRFPFEGLIDEVAIYERVLNPLDVKRLFEANSAIEPTGN